jgi:SAM-dependent methyltransferase
MNPVNLYLSVREKEGRLYTDRDLIELPYLPRDHPLAQEWQARAVSSRMLKQHLARRGRPLTILELGCGNGWLSGQLASIPETRLWGLDLYSHELVQAARLFTEPDLMFLAADIFSAPFPRSAFDVIVLASVIQYFPDLPALLADLRPLLKPMGEIHLIDSPLYEDNDLPAARLRTHIYYVSLGFPEMAEHYFHHPVSALDGSSPTWLYRPEKLRNRLIRRVAGIGSPFPWICLR